MENKEIPQGVEVIGLYFIVIGIFGLIFTPSSVIAGSFAVPNLNMPVYYLELIFSFLVPIFLIVMGVKLKKGKSWAKKVTITISFIYLIIQALYWLSGNYLLGTAMGYNPINLIILFFIPFTPSYFFLLFFINLLIYGSMIGYLLFNKKVKEFFGR